MSETFDDRFTRLIRDGNFLGAGMLLRQRSLTEEEPAERAGELAGAIVDELTRLDRREDRERILYLRSIMAWLFRDIPGLSALYREQLSAAEGAGTGPMADIYRNVRTFADVATGRKKFSEGAEETAENLRHSFEDAAESFSSGRAGQSFDEFARAVETGLGGNFSQFGDILRRFTDPTGASGMRSTEKAAAADDADARDTAAEGQPQSDRERPPRMEVKSKPVDIETED